MACLFAYLLGLGWLAPFVTALVAASDEDHRVLLCVGGDGARIVLAHDASRPGMQVTHHHCPLAAILVAIASDVPGGQDHVLSFPSGLKLGGNGSRCESHRITSAHGMTMGWLDPVVSPGRPWSQGSLPRRAPALPIATLRMLESTVLRC